MPYREKFAWLSLLAIALTYGPYFVLTALEPPPAGVLPNLEQLRFFGAIAIAQMVILLAGRAVLAARTPKDERGPADERDRAVELRASRIAYYVLITGVIVAGVVLPFVASGWQIVNAALASIVLAEVVQHGLTVRSYRQGWHD